MLVVISDIHLEEEFSRNIRSGDPKISDIIVTRNVSPHAFQKIFGSWDKQAERAKARRFDLVLAGDIFDLHRTAMWFHQPNSEIRPYVAANPTKIDSTLEQKIIDILDETNKPGSSSHQILDMIRELASTGTYLDENKKNQSFFVPVKNIQIHYLPGNHDRFANGTSVIRKKVRQLLGMGKSSASFPNEISFPKEKALVRHGHEYDRYNFSADLSSQLKRKTPLKIQNEAYEKPTIGDFVTVDIASRLSHEFRQKFGDESILKDKVLRNAYERIIEFDDLRPQIAALNYLLQISLGRRQSQSVWRRVYGPVLVQLLDKVHDDPFLKDSLKKLDKRGIDEIDLVQAALFTKELWKNTAKSYDWVKLLAERASKAYGKGYPPERYAAHEGTILKGEHRFIVAGHTHHPTVEFIGKESNAEQFYINTGTWRRRIFANAEFSAFGQVKALTYAIIYGFDEDGPGTNSAGQVKVVSLDFWTGVTERWFA